MQQHTYTQRARHTHSPARLPVPVGRHPGLCLLVTAPSAHHTTPHPDTLAQLLGTPQGTIQGVHAGATAALPFLRFMDIAYRAFAVLPFRFPGLMWVDNTIVLLKCSDTHPI